MENNKEKCSNLQINANIYDSSSILAPRHNSILFLLIKLEMSRLHHFEAFEFPVQ